MFCCTQDELEAVVVVVWAGSAVEVALVFGGHYDLDDIL